MLFVTDRRTATTRASQGSPFARDFPPCPSVNSVSSVVKSVRSRSFPHPQFPNSSLFTLSIKSRQRVTPPKPKSRSSTLQPTPLFSTSSALFPPTGNPQLALFQSLPHSFPSHGGGWGDSTILPVLHIRSVRSWLLTIRVASSSAACSLHSTKSARRCTPARTTTAAESHSSPLVRPPPRAGPRIHSKDRC